MRECKSIEEVRENIDKLDNQIVKLISERSSFVEQAAKFKIDTEDVKAPKRVDAVIEKVRNVSNENNVNPDYRRSISNNDFMFYQSLIGSTFKNK